MASIGMLESIPEAPSDGREVGMDNPLTATVSGSSALFVERMVILGDAAESLLCKLYELYTMQDYLASGFPKLSELLVKKFPQHPSEINLSKVDKNNLERLLANVEGMLGKLKPWYFCLVDVMEYYKGVLSVLGEANTLLRSSDPALVENLIKSFAQTASDAVRVQILLASTPRVLIVQLYALAFYLDYRSKPISGFESREKPHEHDDLLLFLTRFDSVIPCLQQDFGEYQVVIERGIKNIFGPYCALASSTDIIASEKIFSDKGKGRHSIGPLRDVSQQRILENLSKVDEYREWTLWLSIACPMILTDERVIEFLRVILDETLLLPVFRDINLWIHAELLVHSYSRMKQILKQRKQPRQGHKTTLRSMVVSSFTTACGSAAETHLKRREFVLQLLTNVHASLLYNSDRTSFPGAQKCMTALALAKSEVLWHMHHSKETIPKGLPTNLKLPYEEPLQLKKCPPTQILMIVRSMKVVADELLKQEKEIVFKIIAHMEERASKIYNVLKNCDVDEFSITAKSIKRILILGFPQAGGSGNMTALRISWLRFLSLYPIVKLQAIQNFSVEKYKFSLLSELQDLINGTYLMDKLKRQISKTNNMRVIYYFMDKLNEIIDDSIQRTFDMDEFLPSLLDVHMSFLGNNHNRCQVIVDDDVAKPVEELLEKATRAMETIFLEIEEEGFGTYEGGSDIIRVSSSPKVKGKSSRRQSSKNIFDILDKKIASPSLLGKYKMLFGLVGALSNCENFQVSKYCIKPKGFLYAALKSIFESFLARTVGTSEPYPDPSAFHTKVSKFMNLLESFQPATTMNIGKLAREVIYQELPSRTKFRMPILAPRSNRTEMTILEKYASWYVSSVVNGPNVVYSEKLRTFSDGNFVGGSASVHLSALEVKSLLKVFGLYGMLAFWNEIDTSITDALNTLHKELSANQTFIAEVIFATSQRGDLSRGLEEIEGKAFILLELTVNAARVLGRCINFLDMVSHAAHLAFGGTVPNLQESLVHALETNAAEVLDKTDFQYAHLLSYALGRKVEGANPVVSSIFQNLSISGKSFDLIEQLFASILSHPLWKEIRFHPESETLDKDMMCIGTAFRHLCYLVDKCTPGVLNESDQERVSQRFESFLDTAAPLVYGDRGSAGAKLMFLENMLDDLYFTQGILEKHFPSILIKDARQGFTNQV